MISIHLNLRKADHSRWHVSCMRTVMLLTSLIYSCSVCMFDVHCFYRIESLFAESFMVLPVGPTAYGAHFTKRVWYQYPKLQTKCMLLLHRIWVVSDHNFAHTIPRVLRCCRMCNYITLLNRENRNLIRTNLHRILVMGSELVCEIAPWCHTA